MEEELKQALRDSPLEFAVWVHQLGLKSAQLPGSTAKMTSTKAVSFNLDFAISIILDLISLSFLFVTKTLNML